MYRALTWLALRRGIPPTDPAALGALAEAARVDVTAGEAEDEPTRVWLDGEDATPHLREPEVEQTVSLVSQAPRVRAALVQIQRRIAGEGRIVMAGRDIGSVVLPDADLKVYLVASPEVRARRREAQLRAAGADAEYAAIVAEIARRDGIDSTRALSPLTPAAGAVIINTDGLTLEEVVRRIVALAHG